MNEVKKIDLPSGAVLTLTLAPFKDGKELFQAFAEELKSLKIDPNADVDANFFKDIFCSSICSKKFEAALEKCKARCLYNDLRIDDSTFEPEKARDDYLQVNYEVARANIMPFTNSLYAKFSQVLGRLAPFLA